MVIHQHDHQFSDGLIGMVSEKNQSIFPLPMPRFLTAVLLIAAAIFALWPQPAVEVSLPDKQCYLPPEFSLQWRHSVEHQLWRESYRSDGTTLHLTHIQMQTFGAGMPSDGLPIAADKGFVAQQGRLKLPELNWTVSRNMQGEVHVDGRTWPLAATLPDYAAVHLNPVEEPRAFVYFGNCL